MQALKEVVDPEIGLSVVDLNMIRDVNIGDEEIEVKMVLTTPFCPLADFIVDEVKKKTMEVAEGREVDVVVLNEPWIPPDRLRGQRK
jgi:ATP-binding protein involved in chromosome partitioning